MEAEDFHNNHQVQVLEDKVLNLNVEIVPVEDYQLFNFKANLNPLYANLLVKQSFILFVLQLRTGMKQRSLNVLKGCILSMCEEALEKNLDGFGFVINGQYFTIKKPNYEAIKDILNTYMVVSKEDNYLLTLRKLRHVLDTEINKYDRKVECIEMIFFTSYVEIDHTLGVKKRSYIDYLNDHCEECTVEVNKIKSLLDKKMSNYNAHVIGLEKNGLKDENYSLADRDLFNKIHAKLGKVTSIILYYWIEEEDPGLTGYICWERNYSPSYTKLIEGFKKIASAVLSSSLSFEVKVPIETKDFKQNYMKIHFISSDTTIFHPQFEFLHPKEEISLEKIYNNGIHVTSSVIEKKLEDINEEKKDMPLKEDICLIKTSYVQLDEKDISSQISLKIKLYNYKLSKMCCELRNQIISFKRIYDGNNKSHLQMIVDEEKQYKINQELFNIDQKAKQIYQIIFDSDVFPSTNQKQSAAKRQAFELYSSLKKKIDVSHEVLMNINKKQIKNDEIGKISQALTFWSVRNSLKNKLVRRINLNPKMIDQTYAKVHQIVSNNDYTSLETLNKEAKHAIGYCIKSGINFATALRKQDCLGILIEIQRPDTAIADPGRIKIRQISPFSMSVSNFFKIYNYGIDQLGNWDEQKGGQWIREYAKLQKQNYKEMWDYWGLVEKKYTVTALVPVYLCKEHWEVAKLLMKPCLGWAVTGQPLGYTFSQAQTIPFMVLSFAIRRVQELTYEIQTLQNKFLKNEFKVTEYSILQRDILSKKILKRRMEDLRFVLQETCYQIMKDMSSEAFEQKLSEMVIKKYQNYVEEPLQRTIDVISNNSAFLSQLYCVIKLSILQKPEQKEFHEFFKRLIEEELRRQTDGWNEQETQDKFINKLLNSQVEKMDVPEYIIVDSQYYDKFQQLQKGQTVHQTYFEITRNQLEMMITKNGKFNDTQRMLLIEYKRLYENRVIWMWYVRFRLYKEIERIFIHKWKSIDLFNSYQLFTMIVQNKKQRKNYKRRQAIMRHEYVDPFDQPKARQYLEMEFLRLRGNQQKNNIQILNNQKFGNAASTFVYTKSLEQAAGALINFNVGQHAKYFSPEIQSGKGIRIHEKLHILLLGEYKNVEVCKGWKMSKKRTNILRKAYPDVFLKYGYMI